jgi:hypothetical protein
MLTDGRFLDVRMGLAIHGTARGPQLKVLQSVFQYQSDSAQDNWIFRYEYDRYPHRPHPPTHFHVRGQLTEDCLPAGGSLEKVHFPASSRVSLESVIRLLIEQFSVPATTRRNLWRAVLTESEKAFLDIAHRAASGPRR